MGASMASPACTSTRTSPLWMGSGNGSAGGNPWPNLPSTSSAHTSPKVTWRLTKSSMSTPRYRSAPPSLSGSAISVVKATTPSSPGTKSSGTAVMRRFSHPNVRPSLPAGNKSPNCSGRTVGSVATSENERLAAMRVEYGSVEKDGSPDLDADWLADGWVALLRKWLADAENGGIVEPNAMVVGTVDHDGRPVTRSVLCKSVEETGITFFTNYDSA